MNTSRLLKYGIFHARALRAALAICMSVRLAGCSQGYGPSGHISLDAKAFNFASSLTSNLGSSDVLWLVNESTWRIYRLSVSRFEIEKDYPMPFESEGPVEHGNHFSGYSQSPGIITGLSGEYVMVMKDRDLAIIRADGSVDTNPVRMPGEIKSYAFAEPTTEGEKTAQRGFLAVSDAMGTLGLMQINRSGQVEASYLAGSILPGSDEQMTAGTAVPASDMLLVSTSGGKLYKLRIQASIEAQELNLEEVTLPAGMEVQSFLPVPGYSDRIMVRQKDKISILDINSMTVVDEVAVDPTMQLAAEFRGAWPHMIFQQNQVVDARTNAVQSSSRLVFVMAGPSGKLSTHRVLQTGVPLHSYVNSKGDVMTFVSGGNYRLRSTITRLRLKDSLVLGQEAIDLGERFAITDQHIIDIKPSVFGAMSRVEIGRPDNVVKLEWFNKENIKQGNYPGARRK